jgi:hypothetical protein
MKPHFFKNITFILLISLFSCLKTDNLDINGNWNLHSMQCHSYNFYQDYKLILSENDSLGNNALIILPTLDTLKTSYILYNDKTIEFTSDTIGNWKGKHTIQNWTTNSLNLYIQSDSCKVLFQFKR